MRENCGNVLVRARAPWTFVAFSVCDCDIAGTSCSGLNSYNPHQILQGKYEPASAHVNLCSPPLVHGMHVKTFAESAMQIHPSVTQNMTMQLTRMLPPQIFLPSTRVYVMIIIENVLKEVQLPRCPLQFDSLCVNALERQEHVL